MRDGTVTDAATGLGMAPSSVSEQIRALERSLGVTLFERTKRGMRLTGDGERLVGWARQLLELADRARRDMAVANGGVTLGALETLVATAVPPILARLSDRRPGLSVDVRSANDRLSLLADVDAGRLDAALLLDTGSALGDLGFRPPPDSLSFLDLEPVPLVLVGRPGAPSADRLLLNAPNCSFALAADRLLGPSPQRTFVGSIATARAWAEQGLGISLLPQYAVTAALEAGRLTRLDRPLPPLAVRLVWRADRESQPEVRALLYAVSA